MQYTTTKKNSRIRILLLAGTLLIIGIVLLDIFSSDSGRLGFMRGGSEDSETRQQELLKVDELLHARLWQLQHMDQQFASFATTQSDAGELSKSNASIQYLEEAFRKSIDSIDRIGTQQDEAAGTNDFQNMSSFFKKILENRRFLGYNRQSLLADAKGAGSDKQTILKLQNELYEKNKIIAASNSKNPEPGNKELANLQNKISEKEKQILTLEAQLQKEQSEKQQYVQNNQKLTNDLAEKDKMIASLGSKKGTADQKALVSLQNDINTRNKQISNLEAQLQREQSEKQQYVKNNQKLTNDLAEKDKMIASLGSKKGTADQKALVSLQNDINTRNKQISNLEAQLQKKQSEQQSYTQTIQKLQAELGETNKIITAANTKKTPDSQKQLVNLQNDLNLRLRQVTTLQAQVLKDQTEIKSNSQTIQRLQKELDQKNKQTNLAASNKSATDQKTLVSLQNDVTEKNKRIRNLETQLQKEQTDKQGYTQTISNLQTELIEKNKIIASAGNRKVPSDQKALVTLQNEIAEKDRRIRSLEDQLQSGVRTVSNTGSETLRDLQQKNTNLRLAYNNTMSQLGVLQRKYNLLKNEMDILKSQK